MRMNRRSSFAPLPPVSGITGAHESTGRTPKFVYRHRLSLLFQWARCGVRPHEHATRPGSRRRASVGGVHASAPDAGIARMSDAAGVSVVVPVFNSEQTLAELAQRVQAALAAVEHELILVDDGSADGSWARIRALAEADERVRGLQLARNYGQHNATLAGIRTARFPVAVTLDDDLQ